MVISVLNYLSVIQLLVEQKYQPFYFSIHLTKIPKLANVTAYQTGVEV